MKEGKRFFLLDNSQQEKKGGGSINRPSNEVLPLQDLLPINSQEEGGRPFSITIYVCVCVKVYITYIVYEYNVYVRCIYRGWTGTTQLQMDSI